MPGQAYAQAAFLPVPGTMVEPSLALEPVTMKGLKVHPNNPLLFDFIIDQGDYTQSPTRGHSAPVGGSVSPSTLPSELASDMKATQVANRIPSKVEIQRLIKYFLCALTIPEKDLWVNLSPYEKDRMINDDLGKTEMGRDMLAQDYLLKQLTASMIYPEKDLGKAFWQRVYENAQEKFGTTDIPVDTFNKVWVVADKADVYVHENTAFVTGAHMKVMLDTDYQAEQENLSATRGHVPEGYVSPRTLPSALALDTKATQVADRLPHQELAQQVIREVIIPEIEKEVNKGANFATLRQMFYAMILATWFKRKLVGAIHESPLHKVYVDKAKTSGVLSDDPKVGEKIYAQYLEAYKKGVFNYIKDDVGVVGAAPRVRPLLGVALDQTPHKYFSGGISPDLGIGSILKVATASNASDYAMWSSILNRLIKVRAHVSALYQSSFHGDMLAQSKVLGDQLLKDQKAEWVTADGKKVLFVLRETINGRYLIDIFDPRNKGSTLAYIHFGVLDDKDAYMSGSFKLTDPQFNSLSDSLMMTLKREGYFFKSYAFHGLYVEEDWRKEKLGEMLVRIAMRISSLKGASRLHVGMYSYSRRYYRRFSTHRYLPFEPHPWNSPDFSLVRVIDLMPFVEMQRVMPDAQDRAMLTIEKDDKHWKGFIESLIPQSLIKKDSDPLFKWKESLLKIKTVKELLEAILRFKDFTDKEGKSKFQAFSDYIESHASDTSVRRSFTPDAVNFIKYSLLGYLSLGDNDVTAFRDGFLGLAASNASDVKLFKYIWDTPNDVLQRVIRAFPASDVDHAQTRAIVDINGKVFNALDAWHALDVMVADIDLFDKNKVHIYWNKDADDIGLLETALGETLHHYLRSRDPHWGFSYSTWVLSSPPGKLSAYDLVAVVNAWKLNWRARLSEAMGIDPKVEGYDGLGASNLLTLAAAVKNDLKLKLRGRGHVPGEVSMPELFRLRTKTLYEEKIDLMNVFNGLIETTQHKKGSILKVINYLSLFKLLDSIEAKSIAAMDQAIKGSRDLTNVQNGDQAQASVTPGGIDLNAQKMDLHESGGKLNMTFDPKMIDSFKQGDFLGLTPVIDEIVPAKDVLSMLGLPSF